MERTTVERAPLQLTITALGANATAYYPDPLGKGQDRIGGTFLTEYVRAVTWADQAGTLTLEDSDDRSTWGTVGSSYTVLASTLKETGWVNLTKRYWRWKYVNGGTAQTLFRLFEDKTADSTSVTVTGSLPAFAATPAVNPVTGAGAQVSGATGAAAPAGATLIGMSDGTNMQSLRSISSAAGSSGGLVLGTGLMVYDNTLGYYVSTRTPSDGMSRQYAVAFAPVGFNGATYDPLDSVNSGQLVVTPKNSGGLEPYVAVHNADGTSFGSVTGQHVHGARWGYIGGGLWDRIRAANAIKDVLNLTVNAGTYGIVWTPASTKKCRPRWFIISADTTHSTYLVQLNPTGPAERAGGFRISLRLTANQPIAVLLPENGPLATVADDKVGIANGTAGAIVYSCAIMGNEE